MSIKMKREIEMDQFIVYLDETVETLKAEEAALRTSDRKDESNFVKIKINICEISKRVYQVVAKQVGAEALKDAYIDKMSVISSNWIKAYEKAKENQDVEKIVIEETKFEMLEQIKSKLLELV